MRKIISMLIVAVMACIFMSACSNSKSGENQAFDSSEKIVTLQRESGSGTKNSFLSFLGLSESDIMVSEDNIVSGTDVMIAAIENNPYAIGYVSFNKLTEAVKVIRVDGVSPTNEGIQTSSYPFVRGLYLVTNTDTSNLIKDFLNVVLHSKRMEEQGFVSVSPTDEYTSTQPSGKLTITGSSSVYPLLIEIIEDYKMENPNAKVEMNQTDSSNGIQSVSDGIVDIAMTSRELTQEELKNKSATLIAKDAIAIIVNKSNPINDISSEKLKDIYLEEIQTWEN